MFLFLKFYRRGSTLTCDVIDHHSNRRVPDVAGNQTAEALLSRRVPELQPHLTDHFSSKDPARRERKREGGGRNGKRQR